MQDLCEIEILCIFISQEYGHMGAEDIQVETNLGSSEP